MGQDVATNDPQEAPSISLTGALVSQLYIVSASSITLTTTFAQDTDGKQVLLPLADWQLIGHEAYTESEPEVVFEAVLPMENIAFLLKDMSEEFYVAIKNLEAISSGSVALSNMQTKHIRSWLADVVENATKAEECIAQLEKRK